MRGAPLFRSANLLEHVARALARSRSKTLARDALRFAFNLHSSTRNIQTQDLRGLDLRVPCGDTWRRAADALFCRGWATPNADALAELLERGGAASSDLTNARAQLLLRPDDWPFPIVDKVRWRTFLEEIGVRDGLWPSALPHSADSFDGHALEPSALARRFRLSEADQSRWTAVVRATPGHEPAHPYTAYRGRPAAAVLPGQADYEQFDVPTRSVYSALVFAGLDRWPDQLSLRWRALTRDTAGHQTSGSGPAHSQRFYAMPHGFRSPNPPSGARKPSFARTRRGISPMPEVKASRISARSSVRQPAEPSRRVQTSSTRPSGWA